MGKFSEKEKVPDYQNKSREELISELQELHKNYSSLRILYQQNISESQQLNDGLAKLYKYSVELSNLPGDKPEVVISKMVKEITGAKAAVFSEYNPEKRTLKFRHIEMEPGLLEKVIKLTGDSLKKMEAPVSEDTYQMMTSEVFGIRNSLNEITFGAIPNAIGSAIQTLLNVDRFIGIVYVIEGRLYGTSLLAMGRNQADPPKQILENIIFLAAQSLHRRKVEEAFQDSEERFRILFEGAPDAIFLADPVSRKIIDANRTASDLLKRKREEIIGMMQHEIHPVEEVDFAVETFKSHISESDILGFTHPVENTVVRSDGVQVPVEIRAQMIHLRGRNILMGIFRNISERKLAETAKQQVLSELQTLIENVQQGVLLEDENRVILFANSKFCEQFKFSSPEEVMGINCREVLLKMKESIADPQKFNEIVDKRLAEKQIVLSEELILTDGRTFERDYIPVIVDGKNYRNFWIFRNITKRKQREKALKDSQMQISALLLAMPDMMFLQNREGVYIDFHSPKGGKVFSAPEYFLGKNMSEILPPDIVKAFKTVLENALRTREIQNLEYSLPMPWGIGYFESRTIAYEDDKILSVIRDITERKQAELQIQQQNLELKKLNEDKDRFMSIVSHDLKTPFNSILGLLDLLNENLHKYDLPKIEKFITTIRSSSNHFYQLLESLLLWAKSQSGKMPYEPQNINFNEVCSLVIEELKLNAEAKNLALRLSSSEENIVFADMEMLKTILRNLISNAIKFTPMGGEIEIYIEDNMDAITVVISDTGIGIPQDAIESLFNISSYHTTTGTSGESGSGLGLFLCKELIEKNKGKIWVESEPEKGSDFKFTLPKYK